MHALASGPLGPLYKTPTVVSEDNNESTYNVPQTKFNFSF